MDWVETRALLTHRGAMAMLAAAVAKAPGDAVPEVLAVPGRPTSTT